MSTESASRVAQDLAEVRTVADSSRVARHVDNITRPKSPRSTIRKAAIALIAAPDPITGVAGVGLLASSYAFKKDPASLTNLALETRKILRDLRSLSV